MSRRKYVYSCTSLSFHIKDGLLCSVSDAVVTRTGGIVPLSKHVYRCYNLPVFDTNLRWCCLRCFPVCFLLFFLLLFKLTEIIKVKNVSLANYGDRLNISSP